MILSFFLLEGCLILSNCLSLLIQRYYINFFESVKKSVTKIILIQQTDSTYGSVDFDDPVALISYFSKLCHSFTGESEEVVDRFIYEMMVHIFLKDATSMDDSIKVPGAKALDIMRSAAEMVHGAFLELGRDEDHSTVKTVHFVLMVMEKATDKLLVLAKETEVFAKGNRKGASAYYAFISYY